MTDEELENFPTSESAKRMLSYVSTGFYDKSYVGKWLFQVMGLEYDDARKLVEELALQMFPETATWGLKYHEIKWNLPVRENLDYESRRKLIYLKRDSKSPRTPYKMEQILQDITGFDVHVCDVHDSGIISYKAAHPNIFKAVFEGDGTLNYKLVKKTIDEMKQSHTTYSIADLIRTKMHEQENIVLSKLQMKYAIDFWNNSIYLDGSTLLNGGALLNASRHYDVVIDVQIKKV